MASFRSVRNMARSRWSSTVLLTVVVNSRFFAPFFRVTTLEMTSSSSSSERLGRPWSIHSLPWGTWIFSWVSMRLGSIQRQVIW